VPGDGIMPSMKIYCKNYGIPVTGSVAFSNLFL
jgi:hypothetical protein